MRISDWSSDVCSSDLQVEAAFGQEPAVERVVAISGFSFSGTGQNAGLAFITLKDWSERGAEDAAGAIAGRVNGRLMQIKDGLTKSEEHTSELPSLMRISYAVLCLTKKKQPTQIPHVTVKNKHRTN